MKKYVVSDAECSVKSDLEEPRIFKMGVEKDREKMIFSLVCDKFAVKKEEGTFQRIKRSLIESPDI